MNPTEQQTQEMTPADLANKLFNAALTQYQNDARAALNHVIRGLMEALVFSIVQMPGDDASRKAALKIAGEMIATAMDPPPAPASAPAPTKPAPAKP